MNLKGLIPDSKQLEFVQGVEKQLIQRRRNGKNLSIAAAVLWLIIQIAIAFDTAYMKNVGEFFVNLFSVKWSHLVYKGEELKYIKADVAGKIGKVYVEEGETIEVGELLLKFGKQGEEKPADEEEQTTETDLQTGGEEVEKETKNEKEKKADDEGGEKEKRDGEIEVNGGNDRQEIEEVPESEGAIVEIQKGHRVIKADAAGTIEKLYVENGEEITDGDLLIKLKQEGLPLYELVGILLIIAVFLPYFLVRWTGVLLKESEEPFRYTFWIEPFTPVKSGPSESENNPGKDVLPDYAKRFKLLDFDLKARLNKRIQRFSLLEVKNEPSEEDKKALTSHIHVSGKYSIRERGNEEWVVNVMPLVRIGPPGSPETLAKPVTYPLHKDKNPPEDLEARRYNEILERIYSSIATQIYGQIDSDIKEKINLFPTNYLKAKALYHEAEDFARSNTIDAYERAIELYEKAQLRLNMSYLNRFSTVKILHMQSKIKIGHAKCLIYKRKLSALSGRYVNPIFEALSDLKEVIRNLIESHNKMNAERKLRPPENETSHKREEIDKQNRLANLMTFLTFPKYFWPPFKYAGRLNKLKGVLTYPRYYWPFIKYPKSLFKEQMAILFDAYTANALLHYQLRAYQKAEASLEDAKAVDPKRSERNPFYLLAKGAVEPDIERELRLFRETTESHPDFQIAQYLLAFHSEMRFRSQNEITEERAQNVIKEYDEVLRINPGNTAALAAQGYVYWLLENFDDAKKIFDQGREIKAYASETYVGVLNYGLARIEAERGSFGNSYELYTRAISSDPGVGAFSAVTVRKAGYTSYYNYIGLEILNRFDTFKQKVEEEIGKSVSKFHEGDFINKDRQIKDDDNKEITERIINIVYSFVLNDYGNACLNYYHRFGDPERLKNAIEAYEKSIDLYPENKVVYYNLANAYGWDEKESEQIDRLKEAVKIGTRWHVAATSLVYTLLGHYKKEIFCNDASENRNVLKSDLKDAVDNIMETTKLSSLYNMYSEIDVTVIDELTSSIMDEKIQEGHLNEQDVQALKILARMLITSKDKEDKAVNFCRYILSNYYPDDFYLSLSLKDFHKDLKDTTNEELYAEIITSNIEYWLDQDPVWYAALSWAYERCDNDKFLELIEKAIKYVEKNVSQDAVAPYKALRDKAQLGKNNKN